MSTLRIVPTPNDQREYLRQATELTRILDEHQERGRVIAGERRRIVQELHEQGMTIDALIRDLGLNKTVVKRLLEKAS